MWWSERRRFLVLAAAALATGGCFRPMLASGSPATGLRGRIELPAFDDRFGYHLDAALREAVIERGLRALDDMRANLSRIVTLHNMSITATRDSTVLVMDATARTYRYLDDEEVAKQKKAAKDKSAKKAGGK